MFKKYTSVLNIELFSQKTKLKCCNPLSLSQRNGNFKQSSSLLADKLILCMPKRWVFHLLKGLASHISLFAIQISSFTVFKFVFLTRTKYRKVSLNLYCFCQKIIGKPFELFGESLKPLKLFYEK